MPSEPSPGVEPQVAIAWSIAQVDGVDIASTSTSSSLARNGSTFFPLATARVNEQEETKVTAQSDVSSMPATAVYNEHGSEHYTALLASLAQAKDGLNARLTEWKEVIGDKEKSKEVLPPGTAGQKGMGKAMMMVQAAKQTDGRADEARSVADVTGKLASKSGSSGGQASQQPASMGLPTDDQESDEDDDDIVAEVMAD